VTDQTSRQPTRVRRPTLTQPKPDAAPPLDDDAAERAAIQEEAAAGASEARAAEARREAPTAAPTREEIRREGHAVPLTPGFEARDGDVLVVTYPEVTLPLPKQYSMMKFGGAIYTRQLRAGDDVDGTARSISAWLSKLCEAEGSAKYRRLVAEFLRKVASE
jgi:hypothetical protein